jgi:outer membrane protein TolC
VKREFKQKLSLAGLCILALSSCSVVQPEPYTDAELLAQARADRLQASREVPPLGAELTLDEAIARALKYNLEVRTRMMEEALEFNQLDVNNYDMLPTLLAQAGYTTRNNERISQSRDVATGELSPSRFISQERSHTLGQTGISWSMLDLGLGYYNSQQQADRVVIAYEKRRKAIHLVMQDVQIAFWRAASAQRMQDQVLAAIQLAEAALMDARRVESELVANPLENLRYQRQLLENLRLLEAIGQELSSGQIELASLINAPLGQVIRVAEPDMALDRQILLLPIELMEEMTLGQNADIREQHYNARLARLEVRKTLVQLFPNLRFDYTLHYDSDRFLVNNDWNQAGAQLSFNLFNLLTGPARMRLAESGVDLADQRRIAMQMAVLAQLHLARLQYANSVNQYERAEQIWEADRRLLDQVTNRQQARMQSTLDVVNSETATLLSQLRRYQAWAETQASSARLQYTLGVEPQIGSVSEMSLEEVIQRIRMFKESQS